MGAAAENEMSEEAKEGEEMPPVKLMDDGRHPNLLGHSEWLKCWGSQVNKAVRAMEEAKLVKKAYIETPEMKAERLSKEAVQMAEARRIAAKKAGKTVQIIGPDGEIIYVTEEEALEL